MCTEIFGYQLFPGDIIAYPVSSSHIGFGIIINPVYTDNPLFAPDLMERIIMYKLGMTYNQRASKRKMVKTHHTVTKIPDNMFFNSPKVSIAVKQLTQELINQLRV